MYGLGLIDLSILFRNSHETGSTAIANGIPRSSHRHDGRFADVHRIDGTPVQDPSKAGRAEDIGSRQLRHGAVLVLGGLAFEDLEGAQVDGVCRHVPDHCREQPLEGAFEAVQSYGLPHAL